MGKNIQLEAAFWDIEHVLALKEQTFSKDSVTVKIQKVMEHYRELYCTDPDTDIPPADVDRPEPVGMSLEEALQDKEERMTKDTQIKTMLRDMEILVSRMSNPDDTMKTVQRILIDTIEHHKQLYSREYALESVRLADETDPGEVSLEEAIKDIAACIKWADSQGWVPPSARKGKDGPFGWKTVDKDKWKRLSAGRNV